MITTDELTAHKRSDLLFPLEAYAQGLILFFQ